VPLEGRLQQVTLRRGGRTCEREQKGCKKLCARFIPEGSGQGLVEYMCVAAAIALGAAAGTETAANQTHTVFLALTSEFQIAGYRSVPGGPFPAPAGPAGGDHSAWAPAVSGSKGSSARHRRR